MVDLSLVAQTHQFRRQLNTHASAAAWQAF